MKMQQLLCNDRLFRGVSVAVLLVYFLSESLTSLSDTGDTTILKAAGLLYLAVVFLHIAALCFQRERAFFPQLAVYALCLVNLAAYLAVTPFSAKGEYLLLSSYAGEKGLLFLLFAETALTLLGIKLRLARSAPVKAERIGVWLFTGLQVVLSVCLWGFGFREITLFLFALLGLMLVEEGINRLYRRRTK